MATVKKSKTKKIVWAVIACILVVALIVGGVAVKSNNKKTEVTLNTISTESIVQTVSSTGTISSGLKREYKPGTVATVKTVNVKVGDEVKKGTVLATFDTSSLDSQVASLNSAYTSANASYQEAVKHQKEAQTQLDSINKQIKKLEKNVEKLSDSMTTTGTTKPATTKSKEQLAKEESSRQQAKAEEASKKAAENEYKKQQQLAAISAQINQKKKEYDNASTSSTPSGNNNVEEHNCSKPEEAKYTYSYSKIDSFNHRKTCDGKDCKYSVVESHSWKSSGTPSFSSGLLEMPLECQHCHYETTLAVLMADMSTIIINEIDILNAKLDVLNGQVDKMTSGITDASATISIVSSTIAAELATGNYNKDAIADAVGDAIYEAIKKGMVEFIDSGAAVEIIEATVRSVDWNSIGKAIASSPNVNLASSQVQLAALYAQKEVYTVTASMSTVSSQKQALNAAKNAYDTVRAARDDLAAGWTADFTGVVTTCDIVAGGQTTALQTAITLENMKERVITISLGEYDVHKVKVGMDATVKTAYGTYDGVVEFIAPTATGGSESSMLDSVGSMAGISGLSSLTSAGAGVECKILVKHPDENIIVGFDADVEIVTGTYNDIPAVPIESIVLEKEGTYVYLYDPEEETVTKTKIETGATSDTSYEVKSGLAVGQQIVATPQTDYEEETFKVKVVEKK